MMIFNNASMEFINDFSSNDQKIPFMFKIVDLLDKKIFVREKDAFFLKSLNKFFEQSKKIRLVSDFSGKGNAID